MNHLKRQAVLLLTLLIFLKAPPLYAAWEMTAYQTECVPSMPGTGCVTNTPCLGAYNILISGGNESWGGSNLDVIQIWNYRDPDVFNNWKSTANTKKSRANVLCAKEVP